MQDDVNSEQTRRHEPWPWIVAAFLVTMMMISTSFAWIAATYPDPVIVDESYEADARSFSPRLRDGGDAP